MLCPLCRPRSPSFSVGGDGGGEYLSSIASLLSSDHICDGPLLLAHHELIEKRRSRGLDACVIKRTEKPLHIRTFSNLYVKVMASHVLILV